MASLPGILEGEMTKIKSMVVSRQVCADVADELELKEYLALGKGMSTRSEIPSSVGSAAFEALIGAIYLDGGFEAASRFILSMVQDRIHRAEESGHHENFKSVLQQHAQAEFGESPVYRVLDEKGPDHKILAVPTNDPRRSEMHGLQHLPKHLLREVDYFFHIYKDLEGKHADTYGWQDRVDAYRVIEESIARYDEMHSD